MDDFFELFDASPDSLGIQDVPGEIIGLTVDRSQRSLILTLRARRLISAESRREIQGWLCKALELNSAEIDIHYPRLRFDPADPAMRDYLCGELRALGLPAEAYLEKVVFTLKEKTLSIWLPEGGADILRRMHLPELLSQLIDSQFRRTLTVELEEDTHSDEENAQRLMALQKKAVALVAEAVKQNAADVRQRLPFPPGSWPIVPGSYRLLYGENIRRTPMRLEDVDDTTGPCTVWGEIFAVESRELRRDRRLFRFLITDRTGSIAVKVISGADSAAPLAALREGDCIVTEGSARPDKFDRSGDVVLMADRLAQVEREQRRDDAPEKRVELHAHTKMSARDAVTPIDKLIETAAAFGHRAVAITDHGVVQAFPTAMSTAAALAKQGRPIKILYGVEGYLVNDDQEAVVGPSCQPLTGEFIAFDLETTGLSPVSCEIIQIGAVRIREGAVQERYQSFVRPRGQLPAEISQKTGITPEQLESARPIDQVLPEFFAFCAREDAVLVAHNASFDAAFLRAAARACALGLEGFSFVDTLQLARALYPKLRSYKLAAVAKHLKLPAFRQHSADEDADALAQVFCAMLKALSERGIGQVGELSSLVDARAQTRGHAYHIILLAKSQLGLKNLYRLISDSHLETYYSYPRILRSRLIELREGLILGSACEAGELFSAALEGRSREELLEIAAFYDYLELQPDGNNQFLLRGGALGDIHALHRLNKTIYSLGEALGRPVVATGDVHFLEPQDSIYRSILLSGHGFEDADEQAPLFFRTTGEMLAEFAYLGEEAARAVVVTNPNAIADSIDELLPVPKGTYAPSIPGAEEDVQRLSMERAHALYGPKLPELVERRLGRELDAIIKHGYSVMYVSAQKAADFSMSRGYFVGSRGSVGSSLVAFMMRITDVNPIAPHYICPQCYFSEFYTDGSVRSGFDLPERACPECGAPLLRDGHDIPFETFLGFYGEKTPDIDQNFSGEVQGEVHRFLEELFGREQVFKAGTINSIAEKTAFGYVKKYLEGRGKVLLQAEEERLCRGIVGVKVTTGQHPGGMVVVPRGWDIYDFTPIQRPADKEGSHTVTTHFDFTSMHDTLLKFDILGHDVPTKYKYLCDMVGVDIADVPTTDPRVISLFTSPEALGVTAQQIDWPTGALGLPDCGTPFVTQMLVEAQPQGFADLVQISGLSHGTDVWIGNAQELIRDGTCTISDVIGARDSIMVYLMQKGLDASLAFQIMEITRKGRAKEKFTPEILDAMRSCQVPEWYIESCKKIKYMFPKAHATSYIMSAVKLGWFKLYHPLPYYATLFSEVAGDFDLKSATEGEGALRERLEFYRAIPKRSATEEKQFVTTQWALEMVARGFRFLPVDIQHSDAMRFTAEPEGVRIPFAALRGVGAVAAQSLWAALRDGDVLSLEELALKAQVSKTVIEALVESGAVDSLPERTQISFF